MKRFVRPTRHIALATFVGCLAIVGSFTGTANAEPTGAHAITVTFFNCSGPTGTPTTFQIEKSQNPSVAAHVVGSTDLFKRTSLTVLVTGETFTWGPYNDSKPLITCNAIAPSGNLVLVTGFFTGS
jgi:hypothetical protein